MLNYKLLSALGEWLGQQGMFADISQYQRITLSKGTSHTLEHDSLVWYQATESDLAIDGTPADFLEAGWKDIIDIIDGTLVCLPLKKGTVIQNTKTGILVLDINISIVPLTN